MFDRPFAAFRIIPYFARKTLDIPDPETLLDISKERLMEMKNSETTDPNDEDIDTDEAFGEDD